MTLPFIEARAEEGLELPATLVKVNPASDHRFLGAVHNLH